MSQFELYFFLGKDHILDYESGFDHILFVLALCATFRIEEWKKILILITAFTLGHSITLGLASFELISVNSEIIEFLIPLTIFVTALVNIFPKVFSFGVRSVQTHYVFALFFGLIHGMGFSNYLRELLGGKQNIVYQLFAFNLGLEVGQIIIVGIFLLISFIAVMRINIGQKFWTILISIIIAVVSILLMKNRILTML